MTGRHVLVARLDNDGDVLLAGPAVRAVAAGAARVTMLCGPRGRRAAELLPGVDAIAVHRAAWIDLEGAATDRAAMLAFVDELAALELDEALIFVSFHQSALPLALLLRMAGVPRISAISEDFPGALLDLRHRDPGDVHEVERALALTSAAGFALPEGDDGRLEVRRDAALPAAVAELGAPYVVVHPGASVQARSWSAARHRELVDALVASGRRVVVTGAPGERELCAFVAGDVPRPEVLDLGGATSLGELAEVLAAAACVVVGNTGPAHLAAAVGAPVVSLFAPTVPTVRWRPWKVPHELLFRDVPCALCRARTCPVAGHPCLEGVSVREVLDAVARLALVTA